MKLSLTEAAKKKEAAIVVIPKGPLILSVTRGGDMFDFGLPGGKLDPGENAEAAARREVFEETGLSVGHIQFVQKFKNDDGWTVHAFITDDYDGKVRGSDEGAALWVEPSDMVQPGCTFRKYNQRLLRKLRLI